MSPRSKTSLGGDSKPRTATSAEIATLAWQQVRKVPYLSESRDKRHIAELQISEQRGFNTDGDSSEMGISFAGFEAWWKKQTGLADPDIPVLPEFMVLKINDRVKAERNWNKMLAKLQQQHITGQGTMAPALKFESKGRSVLWCTLTEKLRALAKMRGQWGDLHSIYETRNESMYDAQDLPPFIRDPESAFSACWDLLSVVLLVYVSFSVPVRACFGISLTLWSAPFFVDLAVDIFFLVCVTTPTLLSLSDTDCAMHLAEISC